MYRKENQDIILDALFERDGTIKDLLLQPTFNGNAVLCTFVNVVDSRHLIDYGEVQPQSGATGH